jgi:hypothetical protein
MSDVCDKKHATARECPHRKYLSDGSLDLAHYARMHPPRGDVNFHDELNAAAKASCMVAWKPPPDTGRRNGYSGYKADLIFE